MVPWYVITSSDMPSTTAAESNNEPISSVIFCREDLAGSLACFFSCQLRRRCLRFSIGGVPTLVRVSVISLSRFVVSVKLNTTKRTTR